MILHLSVKIVALSAHEDDFVYNLPGRSQAWSQNHSKVTKEEDEYKNVKNTMKITKKPGSSPSSKAPQ